MFEFAGLEHGGRVRQAATAYQIPLEQWLDLSTGINPIAWPVPEIDPQLWQRLPEEQDGLLEVAADYYGCRQLLPVAGSQVAIQWLPRLRSSCRVGVLTPGYSEHAHCWRQEGHQVQELDLAGLEAAIDQLDVVVIARPNNPDGLMISLETLQQWQAQLAERGGWLVIDEAFIDATPEQSLLSEPLAEGLIVMRSLGKFFGLAGARIGFLFAEKKLLQQLQAALGPWSLNNPARWLAMQALKDKVWQQQTRERLILDTERLQKLLTEYGLEPATGATLFQLVRTPKAAVIFDRLASQGVLVRIIRPISSLRFGLPGSEADWQKLEKALSNC
ncbi:MAG: threonine-phosphate decarboxylase CobD [Chromatiales bacterium]|nr:threonine-phosphate decarboxylase CobD [Chromatiales bacterium]